MGFFDLISTAYSCVFYGVIITLSIMAVLYFVLRLFSDSIVKGVIFYITGVFMFLLLSVQLSLMVGAIRVDNSVGAIEININQIVENAQGTFGVNDSQMILDGILENYPLLNVYVTTCDFSGNDATTIAGSMSESLHKYLRNYIWHRVLWSLGIIIIGCLIALMFDKGKKRVTTNDPNYSSSYSDRSDPDNF